MVKVSVVVPVYNPGPNMDDLITSVLGQSLPHDEYEAIFVDDGSTDGTGERLDALAAEHDVIRVEHIPNSGWPGRPRNVGTDLARGEHVLYVDNDDYLAPEALERLHAKAVADGADIVVGKVVGHDKFVSRELFEADRSGVTIAWHPLIRLLSPHKLFRRSFLAEHGIRFPEGRRRLEDHVFVMQAFFAAEDRISILASYPCYHWMLRPDKDNASWGQMDPEAYYGNLREVIDIIEANVEPGTREWRRLLSHWYRSKVLWRLTGAPFLRREPAFNRELYDACRAVTVERFPVAIDKWLPFALRVRSHLLRADDLDGLYAFARFEVGLRARVRVKRFAREPHVARLRLEARLQGLQYRREGERVIWYPPPELRERLEGLELDFTKSVERAHLTPVLRAVADKTEVVLDAKHEVELRPVDEEDERIVTPVLVAELEVPVGALAPGEWQLVVPVRISGLSHTAMTVRLRDRTQPLNLVVRPDGTFHKPSFIRRNISGRAPKLVRLARRTQARLRRP